MDEPLGKNDKGEKVYLKDIWPTQQEVNDDDRVVHRRRTCSSKQYANVGEKQRAVERDPGARAASCSSGTPHSTYIQEPPFFTDLPPSPQPIQPINGARVLVMVGDSVTTDHISPAGSIKKDIARRAST